MTQLFALHSAYGLATAVGAIDEGLIPDSGSRILVPFNSARVPETTTGIEQLPNLASLRDRFDRVESLDALLTPQHPSSWSPADADLPVLNRLLTRVWELDGPVELFVQSPQVAPALTLLSLFPDARVTIVGDGLMTYSPVRVRMPRTVVERIVQVAYADVVPGVEPLLFPDAARLPVPPSRLRDVLAETAVSDSGLDALADGTPTALVLGQYLAALNLVSTSEEAAMQADMVDRALQWAPERIVFKPHPSAPPAATATVRERADRRGVEFVEYHGAEPAELLAERLDVVGVVAGFSTALPTVQALFGRPIAAAGTATVLRRLTPYENSNRIPATIIDALTRPDSPYREPGRLQLLADAVGYAMQPVIAERLRPRAEQLLRGLSAAERDRYFAPARLAELRLPGAPREGLVRRALRSAGGVGRVEELRLTISGARRRAARAWNAVRGR